MSRRVAMAVPTQTSAARWTSGMTARCTTSSARRTRSRTLRTAGSNGSVSHVWNEGSDMLSSFCGGYADEGERWHAFAANRGGDDAPERGAVMVETFENVCELQN